ncbi:MAG: SDR family NAD(P)-dependent oxidoreductase [Haliea sp.]|nr:SDR family NAD(P)-dependent oxidoreductase [Haliea sp.]
MFKNLFSYEGKRVVITGASSGMGEATAKLVHELGAEVVAVDIQPPKYDFASYVEVDLRDRVAIEQAVAEIAASRVHNLFYCAGLPGHKFSAVDVVTVNFISQRHMIHQLLPHLKRGRCDCQRVLGRRYGLCVFRQASAAVHGHHGFCRCAGVGGAE